MTPTTRWPQLKLFFNEEVDYELRTTEFQLNENGKILKTTRRSGKSNSFSWSRGVRALTIFLVQYSVWSKKRRPEDFEMCGERKSPAATLDIGLGKAKSKDQVNLKWQVSMFGQREKTADSYLSTYIERTNPDKKRRSDPFGLKVLVSQFPPICVRIFIGEKELKEFQELEELSAKLCKAWKGEQNLPLWRAEEQKGIPGHAGPSEYSDLSPAGSLGADRDKAWPTFLRPLTSDDELRVLIQIAALSKYRVALPANLVRAGLLDGSLKSGLVSRSSHGTGRHEYFQLCIPSMAKAILDANRGYDANQAIRDVAGQHPFTATMLAEALERNGRRNEAISMLRLALSNEECFPSILGAGLQFARVIIKRFIRLEVLAPDDADLRTVATGVKLVNAAIKAPPPILLEFLNYCRHSLPNTNQHLTVAISTELNVQAIAQNLLQYPLPEFANVVLNLKSSHPILGGKLIAMSWPDSVMQLMKNRVLTDPLLDTFRFCISAQSQLPQKIFDQIVKELTDSANQEAIKERLLNLPALGFANTLQALVELDSVKLLKHLGAVLELEVTQLDVLLKPASMATLARLERITKSFPKPVHNCVCKRLETSQMTGEITRSSGSPPDESSIIVKQSDELLKNITKPMGRDELAHMVFESNADDLSQCLSSLARSPETKPVSQAIIEIFQSERDMETLRQWAWRNAPERMTAFIIRAKKSLPFDLVARITQALADIPPADLGQKLVTMKFAKVSVVLDFGLTDSPTLLQKCKQQLAKPGLMGIYRNLVFQNPLGDIVKLLKDADKLDLYLLAGNISSSLAAPENAFKLTDLIWTTPLNYTQYFLEYTRTRIPAAHKTVVHAIALAENKPTVLALAKACWLGELVSFMAFAETYLPAIVYRTLLEFLSNPVTQENIKEKAGKIPPHQHKSSLEYLGRILPEFQRELIKSFKPS